MPAESSTSWPSFAAKSTLCDEQLEALTPPKIYAGTFKQPEATHVLYRGEPLQKREQIAPGGIASCRRLR